MRGPMVYCLGRSANMDIAQLDTTNLSRMWLDTSSLGGPPVADHQVRNQGLACVFKGWPPGQWFPWDGPPMGLLATEFADPEGETTYLHLLDPHDERVVEDDLVESGSR